MSSYTSFCPYPQLTINKENLVNKRFRIFIVVILPMFVATATLGAFYFSTVQANTQATLTVTTLTDENDGCGVSDCSLREAIAAAADGDRIEFSVAGTIVLDAVLGELFIDKSLTIDGGDMISVSGDFNTRVFNLYSAVNLIDVTLQNMTISDGFAMTGDCGIYIGDLCGGGIMVQNELVNLTVNQVLFINNSATFGGAINGIGGNLTIIDSVFDFNYADFMGAAIYHNFTGTVTIENSQFLNNYADALGGAISTAFSTLRITDSLFQQNEAFDWGGAIETYDMTSIDIISSQFLTNTSSSMGGAFYLAGGPILISDTQVIGNVAFDFGGGGYTERSDIDIQNSEFAYNETYFGGGMTAYSSTVNISHSLFDQNIAYADGSGGGLYQTDVTFAFNYVFGPDAFPDYGREPRNSVTRAVRNEGSLTIDNSTFSNNISSFGGGVMAEYIAADISQNTVFQNNTAFAAGGLYILFSDGVVEDTVFENNEATGFGGDGYGGGIASSYQSTLDLRNSQVISNYGGYGGGLYTFDAMIQVDNTLFASNEASIEGGGIKANEFVTLDVMSTTIEGNVAPVGGGVHVYSSTVGITESTIQQNNAAQAGGGVFYSAFDPTAIVIEPIGPDTRGRTAGHVQGLTEMKPAYMADQLDVRRTTGRAVQAAPEMTINESSFSQNTAGFSGGGALIEFGVATIENGMQFSENSAQDGGAVYAVGSEVAIRDANFVNNQAINAIFGGGALIGEMFTVADSTFTDNSATFAPIPCGDSCPPRGGGAIHNMEPMTITNSVFTGNTVDAGADGGGALRLSASAWISASTFVSNEAISGTIGGGAIYADEFLSGIHAEIYNSWFEDNYGTNGGAIYNYNSEILVHHSGVVNNRAVESGGGLYGRSGGAGGGGGPIVGPSVASGPAIYRVENSTLSGNTAETVRGGGLYLREGGTAYVANSTISGNSAAGQAGTAADAGNGGGIYVGVSLTETNHLTLDYVTLTDNEAAGAGGGIDFGRLDSDDQITVTNTILAGNWDTAGYPECYDNNGTNYTLNLDGYNILGGTAGDVCAAGGSDLSLTDLGVAIADVVAPLADNHGDQVGSLLAMMGTMQTHALPAGSVALDAADPAACGTVDQSGVARPIDANGDNQIHCDIGAYEAAQSVFNLFMPMMSNGYNGAPDLIVEQVVLTTDDVSITISNIGEGATLTNFWVDININPENPPIDVNETWEVQGGEGIVWGITDFSLGVGESLTLNLSSSYYNTEKTNFSGRIEVGDVLYAQVDAANTETTYGNVYETHEIAGGAYNNLFELMAETAVSTD